MFDSMVNSNEKVLWEGRPHRLLYIIGSPYMIFFSLVWLIFDLTFIKVFTTRVLPDSANVSGFPIKSFFIIFMIIHLAPVWITIIGILIRMFNVDKVEYVITDKRIYLVTGLFANKSVTIEAEEIKNVVVDIGFIHKKLGLGTVRIIPESKNINRNSKTSMFNLNDPYDAYKAVKKLLSNEKSIL